MDNKVGAALSAVSVGTATTGLLDTGTLAYISMIIALISGVLSIAFTVYRWYKSASKDGKITADEVDELVVEVAPIVNDLGNKVDETKKEIK